MPGRVAGVVATQNGKQFRLKAICGVVLVSGGFHSRTLLS
jgi:hypothetical protein